MSRHGLMIAAGLIVVTGLCSAQDAPMFPTGAQRLPADAGAASARQRAYQTGTVPRSGTTYGNSGTTAVNPRTGIQLTGGTASGTDGGITILQNPARSTDPARTNGLPPAGTAPDIRSSALPGPQGSQTQAPLSFGSRIDLRGNPTTGSAAANGTANIGTAETLSPGAGMATRPTGDAVLTEQGINTLITRVESAADLSALDREELLELLQQALVSIRQAVDATARAAELRFETESAPALINELRQAAFHPTQSGPPEVDANTTLEEAVRLLADQEARIVLLQTELKRLDDRTITHSDRVQELPALLELTRQRLAEADGQIRTVVPDDSTLNRARGIELRARAKLLAAQLEQFTAEQDYLQAETSLLPLQRAHTQRELAQSQQDIQYWRDQVNGFRQNEAERQALAARAQAESAHPAVEQAARHNAELADERTGVSTRLERQTALLEQTDAQLKSVQDAHTDIIRKEEMAGLTTALGHLMRARRSQLPNQRELKDTLSRIGSELPTIQLRLLELNDERDALPKFEADLDDVLESYADDAAPAEFASLEAAAKWVRHDRQDFLNSLIADYETYRRVLSETDVRARSVLAASDSFASYVDENILWIRSAEPVTRATQFSAMGSALVWLLSPSNFGEMLANIMRSAAQNPLESLFTAFLFGLAFGYGRAFRRRMKHLVTEAASRQHSLSAAARGIVFCLLAAAVWPALLWFLGWRLDGVRPTTDYGIAFAAALKATAVMLLTVSVVKQVCRFGGVGEQILGWNRLLTAGLRDCAAWGVWVGCPLVFAVTMLGEQGSQAWTDSLGRMLFISGMFVIAAIAHRLLRVRDGILAVLEQQDFPMLTRRVRQIAYAVAMAMPLTLAGLAAAGYLYTAEQMAGRMMATIWLATGTILGFSLARRWLSAVAHTIEVRLLARRRQEQQQIAALEASPELTAGNATVSPLKCDTGNENAATVRTQLTRLLRTAVCVTLAVGTWSIWSSVLPAIGVLDHVEVGSYTAQVEEAYEQPDGTPGIRTASVRKPVTLKHVLLAVAIVVLTTVASRNLPGLLEAALFQRLPLDAGGRYAATTISRYVVTTAGWAFAFHAVGVTWASIQWLVAAMTVGLGFGLQEIFANFVSGLIILFERPVRVGDLVTVAGTTGHVTKMRIRATTITDPDRRELLVPNKKFITDEFVNWTLSDPITRVVFEVGVAYGSDTAKVHDLLMKIAQEHPLVMVDPAPSALMTGFGDSTLDFQLRVFIASRASYAVVVNELNMRIDREFAAAEIEIAFPQRDINIRTINGLENVLRFPQSQTPPSLPEILQPQRRAA